MNDDQPDAAQNLFESNYPQAVISTWLEYPPPEFIEKLTSEMPNWLDPIKEHTQMTAEDENLQGIEISGIAISTGEPASFQEVMGYICNAIAVVEKLVHIL